MIFQVLPLLHFNKYKSNLWTCWFLAKNLCNFVSQTWNSTNSIAIGSTRCFKIIQIGTCWLKPKILTRQKWKKKCSSVLWKCPCKTDFENPFHYLTPGAIYWWDIHYPASWSRLSFFFGHVAFVLCMTIVYLTLLLVIATSCRLT